MKEELNDNRQSQSSRVLKFPNASTHDYGFASMPQGYLQGTTWRHQ
jgi:hypothetical protein